MNREQAERFTKSLGKIVGGSVELIKQAHDLGVPKALGMTTPEWVHKQLGGYAKLPLAIRDDTVRNLTAEGRSTREVADIVGISKTTVNDTVRNWTAERQAETTARVAAERQARDDLKVAELFKDRPPPLSYGIQHGDFKDLVYRIPDESTALIFIDPPYDAGSTELYGAAAQAAQRILIPGGSFVAYSGQKHLREVLNECSGFLRYWWTFALIHEGGNQILNKLGARCEWKPLVWFVKGTRAEPTNVLLDVIKGGGREKDDHEWQQAEAEAVYFIEKLTKPENLVVDFFAGSGTSGIAAAKLNRRWVGFEKDAETASKAKARLVA
jgi:16S rRNA G966 N2-methylase RsmD